MTDADLIDAYGTVTEPATLTIRRILPGPVERVWSYLVESEKRRRWLAAGDMVLKEGAPFTLIWRNDELTEPPGAKPEGFGTEHSMESEIVAIEPPHRLAFTWGRSGGVEISLVPQGRDVLLTLVHRRLPDRDTLLLVGPGWHAHLDILVALVSGRTPAPFWDEWVHLRAQYAERLRQ